MKTSEAREFSLLQLREAQCEMRNAQAQYDRHKRVAQDCFERIVADTPLSEYTADRDLLIWLTTDSASLNSAAGHNALAGWIASIHPMLGICGEIPAGLGHEKFLPQIFLRHGPRGDIPTLVAAIESVAKVAAPSDKRFTLGVENGSQYLNFYAIGPFDDGLWRVALSSHSDASELSLKGPLGSIISQGS